MLIGFTGLSGAGKSTAIEHLAAMGFGCSYYAGAVLREEIARRGLELTPDNERRIREELREARGMTVFAEMALPRLRAASCVRNLLLDAVYGKEELDFYHAHFSGKWKLIAIKASFSTRSARLQVRAERPMNPADLRRRDQLELTKLRLGEVVSAADHQLDNETSLYEFKQALNSLAASSF